MMKLKRDLPGSGIRQFFDMAQKIEQNGQKVLHMEIGRPVWQVPEVAQIYVNEAMDKGIYHYMSNRGNPLLRQHLVKEVYERTGNSYDSESEIILTTGASEGLSMCALALLDQDDEMVIPEPAWPHYKAVAKMAGAKVVTVDTSFEDDFNIDIDKLKRAVTNKTKILVVNSPNNPTGAVLPQSILKEIALLSEKYGFYVLADEVYDHFVYNGVQYTSMATVMKESDRLIYLNSLSKTYSVTGWRIGYLCCNRILSDALNRVHQYLTVCGVSTVHYAAHKFLIDPSCKEYLDGFLSEFEKRRSIWKDSVFGANFSYPIPNGAFYIFPKFKYENFSDYDFCKYALKNVGLCMVPGSVFGDSYCDHVRIAYSGDIETQKAATKVLHNLLD